MISLWIRNRNLKKDIAIFEMRSTKRNRYANPALDPSPDFTINAKYLDLGPSSDYVVEDVSLPSQKKSTYARLLNDE